HARRRLRLRPRATAEERYRAARPGAPLFPRLRGRPGRGQVRRGTVGHDAWNCPLPDPPPHAGEVVSGNGVGVPLLPPLAGEGRDGGRLRRETVRHRAWNCPLPGPPPRAGEGAPAAASGFRAFPRLPGEAGLGPPPRPSPARGGGGTGGGVGVPLLPPLAGEGRDGAGSDAGSRGLFDLAELAVLAELFLDRRGVADHDDRQVLRVEVPARDPADLV